MKSSRIGRIVTALVAIQTGFTRSERTLGDCIHDVGEVMVRRSEAKTEVARLKQKRETISSSIGKTGGFGCENLCRAASAARSRTTCSR